MINEFAYTKLLLPSGPIPHKMAKTFDGPPTLERSGSEHRRAVTSPLPEEEGLGEKVELSLQERRRGRKVSTVGRLHPLVPEGFCPLEGEPKGS